MELALDEIIQTARRVPGGVAAYQFDGGLKQLYVSSSVIGRGGRDSDDAAWDSGHSTTARENSDGTDDGSKRDALEFVDPAFRDDLIAKIRKSLGTDEDIDAVYRIPSEDGLAHWVHSSGRHIGEYEGKPVILCTIVDTSMENAQQQALVEYSGSPTYVIDAHTHEILYMSRPCMQLFGGKQPRPHETCYAYKHDFDAPCSWCLLRNLDGDSAQLNEFYNEETGRWHQYNYHRLTWFGVDAIAVYAFDITARKQELAEVEFSRRRYLEAIQTAKLAVWEYDIVNHRVTMSDDPYTSGDHPKFGLPRVTENVPDALIGYIDDDYVDVFLEMYRKVEQGQDATCDVWYKQKPGQEPRCERIRYTVEFDNAGKPVTAHGIGQNITAEKKVEERYVRETEMLSRNTSESMIAKAHSDLTANQLLEYEDYSGMPIPARAGATYDEAIAAFLSTVDRAVSEEPIGKLLSRENLIKRYEQGDMSLEFSYRWTAPGKVPVWATTTVHTYMMPSTGDLECFAYTYDITDKALEEQIISKLVDLGYDELGFIYPATGSYTIYRIDRHGHSIAKSSGGYNSALGRQFGGTTVIPETASEVHDALVLATVVENLEHNKVYSYSATTRREGWGDRRKLFQFSYLDEKRDTIFFCMSDVTEQHRLELEQIEALKEAKLDADKANEAKSAFLSSMSHDIRTPLNGVIGFTELAIRANEPAKKEEYLEQIESSGKLLLDLVNDTLELSRIESGKITLEPEATDIYEVAKDVVVALLPSAKLRNITLDTDIRIPRETASIDKLKFQKILLNLISNSIKYTPEGGSVKLTVEAIDPPLDGRNRRMTIEDTGIGMSPEFQKRMFDPFAQEKRPEAGKATGTGLGLAIIKRIVDMMDGTIAVRSETGKGTRFTVDLPIKLLDAQQVAEASNPVDDMSLIGTHVLLCEDNWMNTEIAQTLLEEKGITVDTAADGKEGLDAFASSEMGTYDAILMDIRMPIMDGREASRAIRALDREDARTIPIIALTADAFQEDIDQNLAAGMNAHVTKPIAPDQLFSALSKALSRR